MPVSYIKGEFLLKDIMPIASKAIEQMSSDIKALGMNNADTILSLQGTVITIAAIVIDHTKGQNTIDESRDEFILKLHAVLENFRNGSLS